MTINDLASIIVPPRYRLVHVSAADDKILGAMEATWRAVRQHSPSLPGAVFEIGPGRSSSCSSVGWDQPHPVISFNLMPDGRKITPTALLAEILHLAAHGLAGPETSQEGRYHSARFRDAAVELGLEPGDYSTSGGWSQTKLRRETTGRYREAFDDLSRALRSWEPTVQVKASRSSRNLLPAQCSCDPPRKLRVSESTLSKGEIRCSICGAPFAITSS